MRLGRVHFEHFADTDLENIHSECRALARDARQAGCYGLSNLLKAFETEVVLELNLRDKEAKRLRVAQLAIVDEADGAPRTDAAS